MLGHLIPSSALLAVVVAAGIAINQSTSKVDTENPTCCQQTESCCQQAEACCPATPPAEQETAATTHGVHGMCPAGMADMTKMVSAEGAKCPASAMHSESDCSCEAKCCEGDACCCAEGECDTACEAKCPAGEAKCCEGDACCCADGECATPCETGCAQNTDGEHPLPCCHAGDSEE